MNENVDLKCQFGTLTRPNGSVRYCEGETAVLAGFYGPVECKTAKIITNKAYIEMNYRPKSGIASVRDRFYEDILRKTCEAAIVTSLYPRSSIVLTVQEMHDDGQLISCSVNAACLACLDSGIEMACMFAASTCFLTKNEQFHTQTPNKDNIRAVFVFVFDSIRGNVIVSHTEGKFTSENYRKALNICRENSKEVFKFIKNELNRKMELHKSEE